MRICFADEYVFKERSNIDNWQDSSPESGDWPRFSRTFARMHSEQRPISLASMQAPLDDLNVPCLRSLHQAAYGKYASMSKASYIEKFIALGKHCHFVTDCQKAFPSWESTTSNIAKITCPHGVCYGMKVSIRGKCACTYL